MARLFGTDGVRGIAGGKLSAALAFKLGFAGASVLAGTPKDGKKAKILIGMDTRISGKMLEAALVAGITSAGADVFLAGVIPTPGISYLVKEKDMDCGIMISASHNSFEYNGIKFFAGTGYKLPDETEDSIESIINDFDNCYKGLKTGADVGQVYEMPEGGDLYVSYISGLFDLDLSSLSIAIDCANGASSAFARGLFEGLGAKTVMTGNSPDGININKDCGSTHLEHLSALTVENKCDMGFAFDGDADRFLAVDSDGKVIDGDTIMSIIALAMKKEGKLKDDTLVVTIMSNLGVDIMAKKNGLNLVKTKVGDRYVLEEMLKSGYNIGGEQSGHVILSDHQTTGDGMLTALALLNALKVEGKSLKDASSVIEILPQVLLKAEVSDEDKEKAMNDADIKALIDSLASELGGSGRILVRPSGTEPIIRVMLEGSDVAQIKEMAEKICSKITEKYGR